MAIEEGVFIDSDNDIELYIEIDGVAPDFVSNGVTSMVAYINGVTVDSSTEQVKYYDAGKVVLRLGFVEGLKAGRSYPISIKVYDALHPNGQVIVNAGMENSSVTAKVYKSIA